MDFVMGFVQQGVSRVLEGAVTAAGGFAGDVVNGAGDMIENSGRGIGNGVAGAFQGWGDYIKSYGDSIVAVTSPGGPNVSTSTALVKTGNSAVTKTSQSGGAKSTPQKTLPYKPPQKLLPAPGDYPTGKSSLPYASKPSSSPKALPAPSGAQSALNAAKSKPGLNGANISTPRKPEPKYPSAVKKIDYPKSPLPKTATSNTSPYKAPVSKPPASKAVTDKLETAKAGVPKLTGPRPVAGVKR